jgi:hypothetical protein
LLQKHLEGTSTIFGVGPNRAKLALSILHKQAGERCITPFTFSSQRTQNNLQGTCDQIRVSILDDGMQVSDVLYCFLTLSGYIGTCCVYPIKVSASLYYELCLNVADLFAMCNFSLNVHIAIKLYSQTRLLVRV